jgi:hypothetical protein
MLLEAILVRPEKREPRRKSRKLTHGGSNANIESRRGTQYYNPSRYPPQSLQSILAPLKTNTRAGYVS